MPAVINAFSNVGEHFQISVLSKDDHKTLRERRIQIYGYAIILQGFPWLLRNKYWHWKKYILMKNEYVQCTFAY